MHRAALIAFAVILSGGLFVACQTIAPQVPWYAWAIGQAILFSSTLALTHMFLSIEKGTI